MNRLTTYLIVTLALLIAATIFFKGMEKAVVDQTQETADVIRKAGVR
jgi:hypothetical protein